MAMIDFGDGGTFGQEDSEWWRRQPPPTSPGVSYPTGGYTGGMNGGQGPSPNDVTVQPQPQPSTQTFDLNSLGDYQKNLEGFDWNKLTSGHNSPKYRVGRVLSHFAPNAQGLQQALPYLNQLGLGTFGVGGNKGDLLTIAGGVPEFNGVNAFDIIRGAGAGGLGWQWLPVMQAMSTPGMQPSAPAATPAAQPYQPTYGQTYGGEGRQPAGTSVVDYTQGMYQPPAGGAGAQVQPQGMTGYGQYFGSTPQEQVTNLYRTYYHRDPNPDELNTHVANLSRRQGSLANIEAELAASGKQLGLQPQYWQAPAATPAASAPPPSSGVPYSDPGSELFQNELFSRMEDLRQPVEDPFRDLFALMALARVGDLQGDPYTAGEDAALRAKYLSPLTEARDAYQREATERMGARGIGPTSGLFEDQVYGEAQRGYERALGSATNDMAVRAIDEKQRREQEALTLLTDLMGMSSGQRNEDDARARELLQVAAMFPEMDERRLQMLLATSGEGSMPATSIASLLMGLGDQNMRQNQINASNSQASKAAWGQFLGYILNNWDKIAGSFGGGEVGHADL